VNEGPSDPAKLPGPEPSSKPPGSRFEDLSDFEVPVDAVATGHRTPILITAAVVLFAGALFAVLYLVLLLPFASSDRGSSVSAVVVGFLLVYGALQAVAGLLVLLLRQSGRWLGIVLAVVGIGLRTRDGIREAGKSLRNVTCRNLAEQLPSRLRIIVSMSMTSAQSLHRSSR